MLLMIFGGSLGAGTPNPVVDFNRYLFPDSTADATVTLRLTADTSTTASTLTNRLITDPSPATS